MRDGIPGVLAWLFLLASYLAPVARGACPYPAFTHSSRMALTEPALLVTHASAEFDPVRVSKPGIDAFVRFAKQQGYSVVYLHEPAVHKNGLYFYGDCAPTYYVPSYGGEFVFAPPAHVISAGGFFENCKERTLQHVLSKWAHQRRSGDLRVTEAMGASYQLQGFMTGGEYYYSFYRQYVDWTGSWAITILDLMKLMNHRGAQLDYAWRYLRRLSPYFPRTHRVVVEWDGGGDAVYLERGGAAPTLTFNFVSRPAAEVIRP